MSATEDIIEIALQILFGILGFCLAIAAMHYRDSLCSVLLRRYREKSTQCMKYSECENVVCRADVVFRLRTGSRIDRGRTIPTQCAVYRSIMFVVLRRVQWNKRREEWFGYAGM
jgi:hypothetical protein